MKSLFQLIGILVFVGIAVSLCSDDSGNSGSGSSTGSTQTHPDRTLAQTMAESHVKNALKAPSTADFNWTPEVRWDAGRRLYSVIGQVDAENSFGAKLRQDYVVIFRPVCSDVYSRHCWEVFSLGIGDQAIIDRELPGSGSDDSPSSDDEQPGNDQVRAVQQALAEEGFDPGSVDGLMGPNTRAAIREYQEAHDLEPDGELSDALVERLLDEG